MKDADKLSGQLATLLATGALMIFLMCSCAVLAGWRP